MQVGSDAPHFLGKALMPRPSEPGTISSLSLDQLRGKFVVLFFAFACPELSAFSDRQVELNAINAQIVAVSCDSHFSLLARTRGDLGELSIPLVSDFDKKISRDYGVLLPTGEPLRATFIIGPEGKIRQATFNDLAVGRSADEMIRLIKAFQFTDEHGEVCPANWQPGDAAMVPTHDGSKTYFEQIDSGAGIFRDVSSRVDGSIDVGDDANGAGTVTRIQFSNLSLLPPMMAGDQPSSSSSSSFSVASSASLLARYQALLKSHPLSTKAVTSCVIALVGELVGSYLKRRTAAAAAAGRSTSPESLPPLVNWRRLGIFGAYGLAITGPLFHWWYGVLEKFVAKQQLPPRISVVLKLLLDRLLLTPPFLLFSLGFIQYFQTLSASTAVANVRNTYAAALYTNWRVWTVAQGINFTYVPVEYRVLYGNVVALWWNVYLSLVNV